MKTLYEGNLFIHYGQFYVDVDTDDDDYADPELAFAGQQNGICGAAQKGKLFLVTGSADAVIQLKVLLHEAKPPVNPAFDEVVEVSMAVGNQPLKLCEWAWETVYDLAIPSGHYRVRYSIQGMEKDYDEHSDWDSPIEGQSYLLEFWQEALAADSIIKHTSDNAKYWHSEWGTVKM